MKVFTVEFTMFNSVDWRNVSYKITATTIEELKESVMGELVWMVEAVTPEEKWKVIEKNIQETTLVFPIIDKTVIDY